MAKIRYLQGTHDARAGDIRDVAQPCAEVLVRLGKAEYITAVPDTHLTPPQKPPVLLSRVPVSLKKKP
nr:hypothetical protein [Escherichia coli]